MNQTPDQIEFERLFKICHQHHLNTLKLSSPSFVHDGYVSKATMSSPSGFVEILYGPPEYHAQIFITSLKEQKRWELKDLMSIKTVREWLMSYSHRPIPEGKSALEREIEWTFLILTDALKNVAGFEWLKQKSEAN
jgi:hypothetical protein